MAKIRTEDLNASIRDIPLPMNMWELPLSTRGFPVPYFAGTNPETGERDFRVVHPETTLRCMRQKLCWICGQPLGKKLAFVVGPMCVVTRTSAEPPSHLSCGEYAAIACPFLAQPNMRRNEKDLPAGHQPPSGVAIMRNPGVTAVLVTDSWSPFSDGQGGILIQMGTPKEVTWYAERREATLFEVMKSVESGLPVLVEQCLKEDSPALQEEARQELSERLRATLLLMPPPRAEDQALLNAMAERIAGDAPAPE